MTNTVTHFEIYGERPIALADFYRKAFGWQFEQMPGSDPAGSRPGIAEIANKCVDEVLAWCVVIFAAFLPFFALKEIERAFGAERKRAMFFRSHKDEAHPAAADQGKTAKPKS